MFASLAGVLFDGFAYGMLLFLLSVGLSVTLGMMNFVNLAHCSFAMVGGYVTVSLMNSFGWPFFATLPMAFLAAALVSILLERTLYRRLYRASDLDQCLFTIGVVFISIAVYAWFYGTVVQSADMPGYLRGRVDVFGMSLAAYRLFLIAMGLGVAALLIFLLETTRFGAQVRAAVDNQRMARGLGIDVDRAFMITFSLAPLLPFVVAPNYLSLASQIAITALVALSLDLILGYAGIVSLGHAAYFGFGPYTAGLLSKHYIGEPLTGLVLSGITAGLLGYATSHIIIRFRHLALIMLTLGLGLLLFEAANSASALTGGADGLQGVKISPLLGFKFDLYGRTAYAYSLAVLFLVFLVARRIIHSPFGLALRGIRENALRMPAIGAPSLAHLRKLYTLAAVMAGVAGALLTQTTSTVSLEVLSFGRSAAVLVFLILGGSGRLYGGIVGAIIYMVARDQVSGMNPQYWYFWIGLLLVAVVMFLPNGILGGLSALYKKPQ